MQRTDVGGYAGEDDLAFILRDDSGSEIGIVPRVDFAVALNQRGVGVQGRNLLREHAVGARLSARGQDDGDVEYFCDGGVRDDVVSEDGGVVIADLDEAG